MSKSHADLVACALPAAGADTVEFARAVGEALVETGFFALTDHGIETSVVEGAYDAAAAFFALNDDTKRSYEDPALLGQRGFVHFGKERAKGESVHDLKEFFHVGPELAADDPLTDVYGANVWPAGVDSFRPSVQSLYSELSDISSRVLAACATYIGLAPETFADMTTRGDSVLRLIHYPPLGGPVPPGAMRAAAHEDINFITLLVGATAPGLELKDRDGNWGEVSAPAGSIIIDSGDMLQNLTNGLFRSTTHRVRNPDVMDTARFSMPFFVHPRADVDLTPLAPCVERTGGAARFPSISARKLLEERLAEIGLGQSTPDHAR